MRKSIKLPLLMLLILSIGSVSGLSISIALKEHEFLYKESVIRDLDSLSANLANDFLPIMADGGLDFELTTVLLRLDSYENIVLAIVYNAQYESISFYKGKAFQDRALAQYSAIDTGISFPLIAESNGHIVAMRLIGDQRLPQGYLVIVNDLSGALAKSQSKFLQNSLPPAAFILLFTIAVSIYLLNSTVKPITLLSEFAIKVSQSKNFTLRPPHFEKYEASQLSQSMNMMMDTINVQIDKNQEYTTRLIEQQKSMEKMANFDALTGLPNRHFFLESLRLELGKAKRLNQDLVLMFFDLDGFKQINDSFGHEVGDKLLVEVAKRVKGYLREGDLVSRLGGDEFLMLLQGQPTDVQLSKTAVRIINGLSQTFQIEGWSLKIGASVGIAKATQSNFELSEFISNADLAMYRSKIDGKGRFTMFAENMSALNKRKLQIANAIDDALINNELRVFYQGKVNKLHKVVGYEALVRWTNEDLGFVSPAEFIPIAEQAGKIEAVTKWVIYTVCNEFKAMQAKHASPVKISINLSAMDIKNDNLVDEVKAVFTLFDIPPECIEFEVTESAYLENLQSASAILSRFRDLGCTIALDDFGTGYSSLAYLSQIDLDTLKIDKQFIDNMAVSKRNELLICAIIDMALRLELTVCAEGIESLEQADFLIEEGCHLLQGFYFAKPMPLENIQAMQQCS